MAWDNYSSSLWRIFSKISQIYHLVQFLPQLLFNQNDSSSDVSSWKLLAWSAPFVTSCEVVRKLGSFRLIAQRWPGTAAGAVSLKLPNFLTTSQDVTKGADQAICEQRTPKWLPRFFLKLIMGNVTLPYDYLYMIEALI